MAQVSVQLGEWIAVLGNASAAHAWQIAAVVLTILLSGALTVFVLVRLPHDHFAPGAHNAWLDRMPPRKRAVVRVLKNLLGVALVIAGALLSLPGVPGQGVLTILMGLMLIDAPWVRRLERRLLLRPAVLGVINKLRKRFGRTPLDPGPGKPA